MKLRLAIEHISHNIGLGQRIAAHAANRRSKMTVMALATLVSVKQRTRWRRSTVSVDVLLGGRQFRVRLRAHSDLEVLNEIVALGEYDKLPCADAKVVVDLGAHIGLATLRLLAANPCAHVVAVEPDPYLVDQLRANVSGLPVRVVHAAISDRQGSQPLYRSDVFSGGNSLERTMPQQVPVTVKTVTFDDLLDSCGCSQVDLLKVDIEGAEWNLFAKGLPGRVQSVVGEIHARAGRSPQELVDALRADGLRIELGRCDATCLTFSAARN